MLPLSSSIVGAKDAANKHTNTSRGAGAERNDI